MALRVGTDLVAVADVQASIDAFDARYLDRVFTRAELADCALPGGDHDTARLAARVAAKEAVFKALRPADDALPWTSVEVHRGPGGAPELRLSGLAGELAERAGIDLLSVSLAHEGGLATAVVVAEARA